MGYDPIGMGDMGQNPPAQPTYRDELLNMLKAYSFKRGDFTLASGKKSEFFLDCKRTLLRSRGHYLVAELIMEILHTFHGVDAVAGVELGGCPLASAVAMASATSGMQDEYNALYIRKTAKDHGTKNLIEGGARGDRKVVLLEDVITTGGSSMVALQALKDAAYVPVAVIVVVDRLEGGSDAIHEKFGIPVISLFTIKDFL